jgi:FlaA1/EpsC-like NDP-sugar epimerase
LIRLFNHHLHRSTLQGVLADAALMMLTMVVVFAAQVGSLTELLPTVGSHMFSLAAGMLVIGTATGLYQKSTNLTLPQSVGRAMVALVVVVPLTYLAFSLLPADMANRDAIRLAAVAGVASVVFRRLFVTHWGAQPRVRSRVLVFGTGTAAQIVGNTLKASDPNLEIVGYFPGPNEKHGYRARPWCRRDSGRAHRAPRRQHAAARTA